MAKPSKKPRARTERRQAARDAAKRARTGQPTTRDVSRPVSQQFAGDVSRVKFILDHDAVAIVNRDTGEAISHCEPCIIEPGTGVRLDLRSAALVGNQALLVRWQELQMESLAQRLRGQTPAAFAAEVARARENFWVCVEEKGEARRERLGDLATRFGAPLEDLIELAGRSRGMFTIKDDGSLSVFLDREF